MITVLIRIAIFITGFAVLIKTTGKVDTEHFYNLPHYILARFISHAAIIIVLKNTINAANLLIHEKSSLTDLNSFILVVMFIAYAMILCSIVIACVIKTNRSPLQLLAICECCITGANKSCLSMRIKILQLYKIFTIQC